MLAQVRPHPKRLILWDVDGTLLSGGDLARDAFGTAVETVLGRSIGEHGVSMSGKTDPGIALEILEYAGERPERAEALLPEVLAELERGLAEGAGRISREGRVHPGVREVLERLHGDDKVLQSVLTGNLAANARVKLAAFGLEGLVDLDVGAFGSDHHIREELIPIALGRVERRYGWALDPGDVWVVGDTPRDLACAKAGGARCMLVGTGRFRVDELEGLGADDVRSDLSDVDAVIGVLLG